MKKRFRSGVNIHRTRIFPGADIGSDHDLVMMTFQVRLKKTRKPNQPRLRFDLEKLRDPDVACTLQATIGGKFAPLIGLSDEDMDMDTMITTYNTAVTDAASEILGKERRRKKPWVTKDVLDLCDERRDLKNCILPTEIKYLKFTTHLKFYSSILGFISRNFSSRTSVTFSQYCNFQDHPFICQFYYRRDRE